MNFFQSLEAVLLPVVNKICDALSDYILIFLLVAVGLFYSIKTHFVQVRCFGEGMRKTFSNMKLKGEKQEHGMSSFQALATAIAAQVGTGNIVGASGAILVGGPGAIFWMWVLAFFGMATIYAEATIAIKTRTRVNEASHMWRGGPAFYIEKAFKGGLGKFLSVFFSIACIVALGLIGVMVQSNSIGSSMNTAFGIPTWITGLFLVVICLIIFVGNVQTLAKVTEKLVPIMAVVFLLGGLVVLTCRIKYLPATFGMIFKYAFQPTAIIGGSIGYALKQAVSQGAKRGLFSNEAGMGSTPHAHAQANVECSHDQGVVAMIGVFIDTFVVLTMNALVIISTMYTPDGVLANGAIPDGLNKTNLAQTAFGTIMGDNLGAKFVAVCLLFFAFSTVLSWNLFGKINALHLFGHKNPRACEVTYAICSTAFVFLGTMVSDDLVWALQDMFNSLMVIPNALALFALVGLVLPEVKGLKQNE